MWKFKTYAALVLASPLLLVAWSGAFAQGYPAKPIRWIIPFAPGGALDLLSRAIQPHLSAALGQPIVLENRSSNAGIVAAEAVARSAPDGYTILTAENGILVFNKLVYKKLPYDTERDFVPVIMLAHTPIALFVHDSVPARTMAEFMAYIKANPGKLNFGTPGVGHAFHLATELLMQRTGTRMVHVPYKGGGPVLQDIASGRIQVMFYPATVQVMGFVKEGRLRALGAATAQRLPVLPATPTFDESGIPNFSAAGWFSVVVPAATPREIIERLNRDIRQVASTPELAKVYANLALIPGLGPPEQVAQRMRDEFALWGPLVKSLGIAID